MAQQTLKCTGCGKLSTDAIGLNKKGEPYLACCPDSNYKPMEQQTAVEWLFDQLPEHLRLSENGFDMLQQAKEMFQQQIEAAWKRGDGEHDEVADKLAKQYYTQTYTK